MSYIIQLVNGTPAHVYWGKKLHENGNLTGLLNTQKNTGLDRLPQEYPQYGSGDFRCPAYQVQLADGSRITELAYKGHRILQGKPQLDSLPAVYCENDSEAQTLELILFDSYSGLMVLLSYTVFEAFNAITRSVRFINGGDRPLRLNRALSASVDLPKPDYEIMYLSGAWIREGNIQRRPIGPGGTSIESRRGASGHQMNPFLALIEPNAKEDQGEVYGFSLVYSGNFAAQAEVDPFQTARVSIGINPFDFGWLLEPGESLPDARGGHGLFRGRHWRDVQNLPQAVSYKVVQRHSSGSCQTHIGQQLGSHLF